MKFKNILYGAFLSLLIALSGCEKDNYSAPKSQLTGNIQFDGKNVGLRSNGVQLELWQHNYALFNKIPVFVDQDGSFSAQLFDGEYKLTLVRGNGPWVDNTDSLTVQVKGATQVNVPVDLYYGIQQESFQKEGEGVLASVSLKRGAGQRNVETVKLYVGQSILVDNIINVASVEKRGEELPEIGNPIQLSTSVPEDLRTKGYAYVRIGVKTEGVSEYVYGEPVKISF